MDKQNEDKKPMRLLTVGAAALRLSVTDATIRRRILERRIDFVKIGRSVRIPESSIEKMIQDGFVPQVKSD